MRTSIRFLGRSTLLGTALCAALLAPTVRAWGEWAESAGASAAQGNGDRSSEEDRIWRTGVACGINAAYALALFEHAEVEYADLEDSIQLSERGASLADVAEGLRSCGVPCEVVRATPKDLVPERLPMLVHLDDLSGDLSIGHYCVLVDYSESQDTARVIDGGSGRHHDFNVDPFRRMWSGYAILPTRAGVRWSLVELGLGLATLLGAVVILRRRS